MGFSFGASPPPEFWVVDLMSDRAARVFRCDHAPDSSSVVDWKSIDRDEDESESTWADRIVDAIATPESSPGIIGVPPATTHLIRWRNEQIDDPSSGAATSEMIRYAAESVLPVEAESIETDHRRDDVDTMALVTMHAPTLAIVDACERRGFPVQRIVSTVMLMAQSLSLSRSLDDSDTAHAMWLAGDDASILDLVVLRNGHPVRWVRVPNETEFIDEELASIQVDHRRVVVSGFGSANQFTSPAFSTMDVRPGSLADVLVSAAQDVLSQRWLPWFDLRRGRLASHAPYRHVAAPLRQFAWIAAASLLALIASMHVRAWRYDAIAAEARDTITTTFRETFPGRRVPAAVVSRFRSEHATSLGQRAANMGDVRPPISAMEVLQEIVEALPESLRVTIDTIRIDDGQFFIDAQLDQYEQAGQLAGALNQPPLETQPPTASQIGGRIQARLNGRFVLDAGPRP